MEHQRRPELSDHRVAVETFLRWAAKV